VRATPTAASAVAGLLLTSCLASTPDRADWREDTGRAVGDVAAEVSTVELVPGCSPLPRFR
jgi:hypothetical protein